MKRLLVLFLGNILRGDDGVGIELLKRISQREIPNNIVLEEGSTGGMLLLGIIENYDRVIIVDAVDAGNDQKDIIIFRSDNLPDIDREGISLHSLSIGEIIRFNTAIGENLPDIIFFGIPVRDVSEGIGLSGDLLQHIGEIETRLYRFILEQSGI